MTHSYRNPSLLALVALFSITSFSMAVDWRSWRGPHDSGSIAEGDFPQAVSADTTLWKSPLPGKGCSTPIVVDRNIFVTAPVDGVDALVSLSWDGQPQWTTQFGAQREGKHRNGSGCNASPVSDGKAVFVYFKSGTLAAVEFDGQIRWQTNLVERFGEESLFWDHGTSPVLTDGHVIFARMHQGESWLAAFDKQTGEMTWKVARNYSVPVECDHGYTTPLVIEYQDRQSILLWGAQHLTIHDALDGKVIWTCGEFNPDSNKLWPAIATPVIIDDMIVVSFGRNDRNLPRLYGVRLSGSGDVTSSNHVWLRDDISSFVPSPIAYQGNVYLVRDKGQVECVDPETGKSVWSDAFPKSRHAFYSSPLIAGGILYAAREDGVLFIARVGDGEFELLSENDMGQPVIGSPIPVGNRILIRGESELICVGSKE